MLADVDPPPAQPLRTIAKTPQEQSEVQALHNYLYLLWQRTGGSVDLIEISEVSVSVSRLNSAFSALASENEQLRSEVKSLRGALSEANSKAEKALELSQSSKKFQGQITHLMDKIEELEGLV